MTRNQASSVAPSAALWASAFVILAMILVMAGRGGGNAAYAEMVATVGDYTVMTTQGSTDELILVLDERNEELLVYKIQNQREIMLFETLSLSRTFLDARRWAARK